MEKSWIHCSHTVKTFVRHFRLLLSINRKENSTAFLLVLVSCSSLSISLAHSVQDNKTMEEAINIDTTRDSSSGLNLEMDRWE